MLLSKLQREAIGAERMVRMDCVSKVRRRFSHSKSKRNYQICFVGTGSLEKLLRYR